MVMKLVSRLKCLRQGKNGRDSSQCTAGSCFAMVRFTIHLYDPC